MSSFASLIGESLWVSQYRALEFGIVVNVLGEPAQADGNVLASMASLVDGETPTPIFTDRVADNPETGVYTIVIGTTESVEVGFYTVTWNYEVSGEPQTFVNVVEVVPSSSALNAMDDTLFPILDSIYIRFQDLFDSPFGGPHLSIYYQTRFNRGRVAELMGTSLRKINVSAQPVTSYTMNSTDGNLFPAQEWGGILEQGAYIEVIKHLMRSYVEQPATPGVNVAQLDRRDYLQRWQTILQMEQKEYDEMMDVFKIRHMGLGNARALVSGGVYGNFGPTRLPINAARPRYYQRFHV